MVPILEERSTLYEKFQNSQLVVGSVLKENPNSKSPRLPHWSLQASRKNLFRSKFFQFAKTFSYRAEWWLAYGVWPSSHLASSLWDSSRKNKKTKSPKKCTTDSSPSFKRTSTGSTRVLWVTLTCSWKLSLMKDLLMIPLLIMTIPLLLKKSKIWNWVYKVILHQLMSSTC